jgi:hypothetical protein
LLTAIVEEPIGPWRSRFDPEVHRRLALLSRLLLIQFPNRNQHPTLHDLRQVPHELLDALPDSSRERDDSNLLVPNTRCDFERLLGKEGEFGNLSLEELNDIGGDGLGGDEGEVEDPSTESKVEGKESFCVESFQELQMRSSVRRSEGIE